MIISVNKSVCYTSEEVTMSFWFDDESHDGHTLEKVYRFNKNVSDLKKEIDILVSVIRAYSQSETEESKYINGIKVSEKEFKDKSKSNGKINCRINYDIDIPYARCVWLFLKKHKYMKL